MEGDEDLPADPGPSGNGAEQSQSSDEAETRWRRVYAYAGVGILFLINLLNYMDRFTIAGVLADIQHFYGLDDAMGGLLQTVFICAYMIFAPLFGYLGDRRSRKMIMAGGISLWSLAVLASSFIPRGHAWAFFLCRALVGIGEASYSTVAPTIIADSFSAGVLRSRMLMLFYFAIPVGSGLGFIVGANLRKLALRAGADPLHAWEWGIRLTPVLGIGAVLLILFVLREPARGESEGGPRSGVASSSYRADLRYLARNRTYLWCTAGFTCVAFVAGCLSWWTPNFVLYSQEMKRPLSESEKSSVKAHISLIFGAITSVSGFVGVGVGSTWSSRWRRSNPRADPLVCAIGLLLATPFLYLGLNIVAPALSLAWICMFLAVCLVSLNWSIVSDILLYVVTPSRRATATALQILASHFLGDAFSPILLGVVSDAICGPDCFQYPGRHFRALKYALFIPTFMVVLGGLFFLLASNHLEKDRRRADEAEAEDAESSPPTLPTNDDIESHPDNVSTQHLIA